jgi:hypothetical protein
MARENSSSISGDELWLRSHLTIVRDGPPFAKVRPVSEVGIDASPKVRSLESLQGRVRCSTECDARSMPSRPAP